VTRRERLFTIKEIVGREAVASQEELRRRLAKRGCRVTQATLSRDMKELGVFRVATPKGGRYALQAASEMQVLRPLVGAEVIAIDSNEVMIVVRTLPGCASTVGEYIDVLRHQEILGTVAGDNTLLVIPATTRSTRAVEQFLKLKLIEGK
jgi:transcriptional regulator of arginine metabolism